MKIKLFGLLCMLVLLSGCSKKPTLGEIYICDTFSFRSSQYIREIYRVDGINKHHGIVEIYEKGDEYYRSTNFDTCEIKINNQ